MVKVATVCVLLAAALFIGRMILRGLPR